MSAAAASFLAPAKPNTLGLVGCGAQAYAHLDAFVALFPGLERVLAFSRSPSSAERLAEAAGKKGLTGIVVDDADALVADSDIVISMVPAAVGLQGFLDARKLKPNAFVAAVDVGRSWLPESFAAFDRLVTDSRTQIQTPYDAGGKPVESAKFETDLVAICGGEKVERGSRNLFCFRGFALGDLALATLVYNEARTRGAGNPLPR
jgi:ornithine cyclodeaminase/alanine dehydrogenase